MTKFYRVLALSVVAGFAAAAPLPAAPVTDDLDSRWLAWLGCWQPVEAPSGVSGTVCVVPASTGSGIELITFVGGAEVGREALVADGTRRALSEGGCTGWETADWAADDRRVYLRSELECEGGHRRALSGVIAFATPTEWLDIQVMGSGDEAGKGVRVVRYRAVSAEQARMLGAAVPADRALAVELARRAAAIPLSVESVLHDVAVLETEAVEALLVERGARFNLNARRLIELADANVPSGVIDLMVALSNPDVFAIDHTARSGEVRPAAPRETADPYASRDRLGMLERYGTYGRYGAYGRYDMYDPFYSGYDYRYGSAYGPGRYYTGYRPVIVVVNPNQGEGGSTTRGRVVRGSGFTRMPESGGAATQPTRTTSGTTSTTSTSASPTQPSSSGEATGRTARPRGEGGGGSE